MEFLGISGSELLLILVVGVVIIGPRHAAQALVWLKKAIDWLRGWSARLRAEAVATENGLRVDLSGFDPRQYDPRRMIKDAVAEEMQLWIEQAAGIEKSAEKGLLTGKTDGEAAGSDSAGNAADCALPGGENLESEPVSADALAVDSDLAPQSVPATERAAVAPEVVEVVEKKPNPATASLDHIEALMKASRARVE